MSTDKIVVSIMRDKSYPDFWAISINNYRVMGSKATGQWMVVRQWWVTLEELEDRLTSALASVRAEVKP